MECLFSNGSNDGAHVTTVYRGISITNLLNASTGLIYMAELSHTNMTNDPGTYRIDFSYTNMEAAERLMLHEKPCRETVDVEFNRHCGSRASITDSYGNNNNNYNNNSNNSDDNNYYDHTDNNEVFISRG